MVEEIPVTQARADFAELVNRVVYGNERIVVTRHGKPIVALVPAADLARLDALSASDAEPERADGLGGPGGPDGFGVSGSADPETDSDSGRLVRLPARPVSVPPATQPRRYEVAAEHRSPGSGSSGRR